jgi:hypothetical protein
MRSGAPVAAVAAITALATAGAVACSSSSHEGKAQATGGSASATRTVQAAYTATTNAKTASYTLKGTVRPAGAGGSAPTETITGSGQVDFATRAFSGRLTVPSGGAVTILQVNGIEYLQVPAAARSQIPGHKPWISINLNKISQAKLGRSFAQLSSASSNNPSQVLSQLSGVSSSVTKARHVTLAGVPTTKYQARINLHRVAAKAQAKEGAKAAEAVRQEINALGTATIPVEVWIGPGSVIRQIRYHTPIPETSTGRQAGHGTAVLTMTFTRFGAPVHLTPPPASQTADITRDVLQHANA